MLALTIVLSTGIVALGLTEGMVGLDRHWFIGIGAGAGGEDVLDGLLALELVH